MDAAGFECDCGTQAIYQETQKGTIIVCPICPNPGNPKYKKVVSWGDMEFASKPKYTPRNNKRPLATSTYNSPTTSAQPPAKRAAPGAPVKANNNRPLYKAPPAPSNYPSDDEVPPQPIDSNQIFQQSVMLKFQELLDVWNHESNKLKKNYEKTLEKLDFLIKASERDEKILDQLLVETSKTQPDDASE